MRAGCAHPGSPRSWKLLAIGATIALAAVIVGAGFAVGWKLPGPGRPAPYASDAIALVPPATGATASQQVEFESFQVSLELRDWLTPFGPSLSGGVLAPNGTLWSFSFLGPPNASNSADGWRAAAPAGGWVEVEWNDGLSVDLEVRVAG